MKLETYRSNRESIEYCKKAYDGISCGFQWADTEPPKDSWEGICKQLISFEIEFDKRVKEENLPPRATLEEVNQWFANEVLKCGISKGYTSTDMKQWVRDNFPQNYYNKRLPKDF